MRRSFTPFFLSLFCGTTIITGLTAYGCSDSTANPGTSATTSDGGADTGSSSTGETGPAVECGDLQTDPKNCGACGVVCKVNEKCAAGACALDTPATKTSFAMRKIFMGEGDRAGIKNKDAWKAFGDNLDNLVSTVTDLNSPSLQLVCKRAQGAPATIHADGDNGIDNAFGKEILKILDPFTPTPSKVASDAIEAGGRTTLINLAWEPATGDAATFAGVISLGEETVAAPKWDGKDTRPFVGDQVTFTKGSITGGLFDSGEMATPARIHFAFGDVPIHRMRVRMQIAAAGAQTATNGTISGVIATEDLVNTIALSASQLSTDLCAGSTIEAIKGSIRQASDMPLSGPQDPQKACDGISIGLGFEAVNVVRGGVAAPVTAPPDPCK